MLFLKRPHI